MLPEGGVWAVDSPGAAVSLNTRPSACVTFGSRFACGAHLHMGTMGG